MTAKISIVGPVFAFHVKNCLPTGDLQAENLEFLLIAWP